MDNNPGGTGGSGLVPPVRLVQPMTMAEALVFCARNRLQLIWRNAGASMFVELVIMKRDAQGENKFAMSFPQTEEIAQDVTIAEHFFVRYLETYRAEYKKKTGEELE